MSKPLFVLVAGVNGSGKSTFTPTFKRHFPNIHVIGTYAIALELIGSFATIDNVGRSAEKKRLNRLNIGIDSKIYFIAKSIFSGRIHLKAIERAQQMGFRTILLLD